MCVAVGTVAAVTRVAFGCTPDAGPVRFDRDSLFEIGSVSKAFAGVLLADMIQRGEIALSDPVAKHARAGAKLPRRGTREMTIGDLLTHISGLPRLPPGFQPRDMSNPYADFNEDALYAALERTQLTREVGEAQEYSNFGFMWLADLMGRRAGKRYDELLRERVLLPLGMQSTMVRVPAEHTARLVQGHGQLRKPVPGWDLAPELSAVGGLRSSLLDMLRFAEAASGRRDSPLKEAFALSFTPLKPAARGSTAAAFGWVLNERGTGRVFWHNGGTGGFRAMLAVNPDTKAAAVVLVDGAEPLDDLALHLVDSTVPMKVRRQVMAMTPHALDEYSGSYELAPQFVLRVWREGGRMITQATGQGAIEIFPEEKDRFFLKVIEAQITFKRDAQGKVESLVLHQGGRDIPGRKLP